MRPAIEMSDVTKVFGGKMALNHVDWRVDAGSIHGLIGANGAGKTTLLRLALGTLWPDQGRIEVLDQQLGRENADLRQHVHYVATGRSLPPHFRVDEWLQYMGLLYDRWDERRARHLVEAMEISASSIIRSLSTGMQASLQLAGAIAARPALLLLDEPTNGMDVVVKRQVLQLMMDMAAAEGTTMVLATHNIEDVERLADSVSVLYRGRFVLNSSLENFKGHMHRLQVVADREWSDAVFVQPHIAHVEKRGQVALVTVEGPQEPVAAHFREAGALLVEPIDMDLAEIFRMVLEKEGYSRDTLAWDA